ncbi:MAG: hypothetical protein A3C44_01035 [Gammaproteobacteria bacterium RIFCSPHIGHO2_02_FULL_39_13]|nr:MAG: hypothetical protein A3C44_01035 [Gammaproteobacteria bacterium RIFCSPHIGHO2_02_FULL_39_13]
MNILVTGAAGFIGYHICRYFCTQGDRVIGIDNLNDYYSVQLKRDRLQQLESFSNFIFFKLDIGDQAALNNLFFNNQFHYVIHLAAQAGVRYSLNNPSVYLHSNLSGFCYILECCRHHHIQHLVFASSSSVYGANTKQPFSENDSADHPLSLYGATKKANELMAHAYANLYQLPCTGLRFFTVYGPWGRPDMALFLFTNAILTGKPINVYNNGNMKRDFTYVDDVVSGVSAALKQPAMANLDWDATCPTPSSSFSPYRIYNIGCGSPVNLMDVIKVIEKRTGKKAVTNFMPMQPGDVHETFADTMLLQQRLHYRPRIEINEGVEKFVDWYLEYYSNNHIANDQPL